MASKKWASRLEMLTVSPFRCGSVLGPESAWHQANGIGGKNNELKQYGIRDDWPKILE